LFFQRFPVVAPAGFWHNQGMPNCAETNAELPVIAPPAAHPDPAPPALPQRPREIGGPAGPEPTRFGDWEKKGRCIDF
jgi:Protein of unknown function (DUF1674)